MPYELNSVRQALLLAGPAQEDDFRFGKLLRAASADAETVTSVLLPLVTDKAPRATPSTTKLIAEVLRLGTLTLAEDVRDVGERLLNHSDSDFHDRDLAIWLQRYAGGAGDQDADTLQQIADIHGLTRERVRQIINEMLIQLKGGSVFSPALARISKLLSIALPCSEAAASDALRPLLGPTTRLRSMIRYATEVLNTENPFHLLQFRRQAIAGRLVWRPNARPWLTAAHAAAMTMVAGCGAAYLPRVASVIAGAGYGPIQAKAVARTLAMIPNCAWLDENEEWFWFGEDGPKNRLVNAVRKVMAVARQPLDLEEIYGGISRMPCRLLQSGGLYPPPPSVVGVLCGELRFLASQNQVFHLISGLKAEQELSPCEQLIYQHMAERAGRSMHGEIIRDIVGSERSSATAVDLTLTGSPILKPVDRELFALRGWLWM